MNRGFDLNERSRNEGLDFTRQKDLIDEFACEATDVTIIGAGGIGSPTAVALSKLGVKDITIYDHDTLEAHNLPSQFYRMEDIGKPKVHALADLIKSFSGTDVCVNPIQEKVDEFTLLNHSKIIISAVDSMEARKMIWKKVKDHLTDSHYIEARMGPEMAMIYTLTNTNLNERESIRWYEETLYNDNAAMDLPCTAKATVYCTWLIGAVITATAKKLIAGQDELIVNEQFINLAVNTILTRNI